MNLFSKFSSQIKKNIYKQISFQRGITKKCNVWLKNRKCKISGSLINTIKLKNYTLSNEKKNAENIQHQVWDLSCLKESQAQWGLRHLVIKEKVDKWNISMPTSLSDNTMSDWLLYRFVGTDVTTLKSTRLLRHRGVNRQSFIYQFNKDDQQIRQVSKNVDNKDLKWQIKQKYSTESLKKKKTSMPVASYPSPSNLKTKCWNKC